MNEAETRAELIDPKLDSNGWNRAANPEVKVLREYIISAGKIKATGGRNKPLKADYVLTYKGKKLAVVEAKCDEVEVGEGVAQAKDYALRLLIDDTYSANGREIYHIDMEGATEALIENFHTPEELWNKAFPVENKWKEEFDAEPYETKGGAMPGRFYQEIAVDKIMDAIAERKSRILLTLATGTGKTFIAFQVAWKLFQSRWNLKFDGNRRPRILFLADRNILADQAFNAFNAFPEDALVRIKPKEIKKKGSVPTNGSLFFTIFQTFMSGKDRDGNVVPYFGDYPSDYFDLIIIDECHRGGANDESNWRGIMEYFSPAVQIGLTATPKRKENSDTYKYFGNPVYIYSLKDGVNDGYLTPFKVKKITTNLDEYTYQPDDDVVEGEVEEGKTYKEADFNKIIEIKAREQKRVKTFMDLINQDEKTLVFCATQEHAAAIRDLINQYKKSKAPEYCVRVTANDGELGEEYLRKFQDNEKSIPTILTTSQKLSTGVDARNVRNIVLLRPVNNIIEFKQIVGRGTRLFDGKNFFTIYDFVNASERFKDPEWDGEPEDPTPVNPRPDKEEDEEDGGLDLDEDEEGYGGDRPVKLKIRLGTGKEQEIIHTVNSLFFGPDGRTMTIQEFLDSMYGKLPELFRSENELRQIWSNPSTRKILLEQLNDAGFGMDDLTTLQKVIDAEQSDLFDVLEFVMYSAKPLTREARVAAAQKEIFAFLEPKQKEFLEFVLTKYIETGVEELDQDKLPLLLTNKYKTYEDASSALGDLLKVRDVFIEFQKYLYQQKVA